MAQIFSKSEEYVKLKEEWKLKRESLIDKFTNLKIADADKKLAGEVRGLVSEYRALIEMEDTIDKFFNKE